jgi:F0F1-type ATP synthase membrane subunit b/b'
MQLHLLRAGTRPVLAVAVLTAALTSSAAFAAGGEDHGDEHSAEHGAHHGGGEVNWYYGMFGTSEEIEHSNWMQRTPGTPVPILAQVFNTLLLFSLLYKYGKQPVMNGLRNRRESILKGMAEAAKMKSEAEAQLSEYEQKLHRVDQEIERVRKQMSQLAAAERETILSEAKKRRERMERDAKLLIQQELKAARQELLSTAITGAMQSAESLVKERLEPRDHARLSDEYLAGLRDGLAKTGMAKSSSVGGAS